MPASSPYFHSPLLAPVTGQEREQHAITFGTYLGGTNSGDTSPLTWLAGVERDKLGNILVVGSSGATGMATPGAPQTEPNLSKDPIVAKYSPEGELLWATYWGGNEADYGQDIAVDAAGNSYITGWTFGDFPVTSGGTAGTCEDDEQNSFVTKFSPAGHVLWSTCVPPERAYSIGLSPTGTILISGDTEPSDLPEATRLDGEGGIYDIFIAEISPDGSTLLRSGLMGDAGGVHGASDMHVDDLGAVYLSGGTSSAQWPEKTPNEMRTSGPRVTKVAPTLDSIEYMTYIGTRHESMSAIAVDEDGQICAAGDKYRGYPTTARKSQWVGCLSPDGTRRTLSYGSQPADSIETTSLRFMPDGRLLLAGTTDSPALYLDDEVQSKKAGGYDGWIADLDFNGETFFSTYIGGSKDDAIEALHVADDGTITFAGTVRSDDLPLVNPPQRNLLGRSDGYVGTVSPTTTNCTILGTAGDDRMWGTTRADVMCGLEGSDVMRGREFGDVMKGGPGHDVLRGGPGEDFARGGRGSDHCYAERKRSCEGP